MVKIKTPTILEEDKETSYTLVIVCWFFSLISFILALAVFEKNLWLSGFFFLLSVVLAVLPFSKKIKLRPWGFDYEAKPD